MKKIIEEMRQKIEELKGESPFIIILILIVTVGLGVGGVYLLYLLIEALYPFIALILIFLVVNGLEHWAYHEDAPKPTSLLTTWNARDVLFNILQNHAKSFDLVEPQTVDDITPTKYMVEQSISGVTFYRFIVRAKPNTVYDFPFMVSTFNVLITQLCNGGFPNTPANVLNGCAPYVITDITFDAYHGGYLHIDMAPILDANHANYVAGIQNPVDLDADLHLFDEEF